MSEGEIEVRFDVNVEGGIVDGLALAHDMVGEAFRHIVTYTRGCPACTVAVLGAMFDLTIEGAERFHHRFINGTISTEHDGSMLTAEEKERMLAQHRQRMTPRLEHYLRQARQRGAVVHTDDPPDAVVTH